MLNAPSVFFNSISFVLLKKKSKRRDRKTIRGGRI